MSGKDLKIVQMQETARTTTEASHVDSRTTIEAEDRVAALSDFIRLKALDSLTRRLLTSRLALGMRYLCERPFQEREWAIRNREPQVKASEAHFLFLLVRLTRSSTLKTLVRSFARVKRQAAAKTEIYHQQAVKVSRLHEVLSKLRLIAAIFDHKKNCNFRACFQAIKETALATSVNEGVSSHRREIAVSLLSRLFSKMVTTRKVKAFTSLHTTIASSFKKEVYDLNSAASHHKQLADKHKQELDNQGTFALSLKAEINKLKSSQATGHLDLQKVMAKTKVLETENAALASKCESLATSSNQLREEKNHLEQLVERIRNQYESLQQDYEEKIDAFNQATEVVSKAAAKNSVEKSALADKIKALVEQREEDKISLYKAGRPSSIRTRVQKFSTKNCWT
jgi:DNA repair exonuclease SbcCD ATPase subunit